MVGLPKTVGYAVKILVCLSLSPGRPVPADKVARLTQIPRSQAAKTLQALRWAGIARSRRGSNGGYELRQSAEEIRVGQVMKLFLPAEVEDAEMAKDPLLQFWAEAEARTQNEWKNLTIAELSRRLPIFGAGKAQRS